MSSPSFLQQVWAFITQPTQPVSLFGPVMPATESTVTLPPSHPHSSPCNRSLQSQSSSMPSALHEQNVNGSYEMAGLAAAFIAYHAIRYAYSAYQSYSSTSSSASRAAMTHGMSVDDGDGENESEKRIKQLVESLQLSPHPEGGYYRRIYESNNRIPNATSLTRPTMSTSSNPSCHATTTTDTHAEVGDYQQSSSPPILLDAEPSTSSHSSPASSSLPDSISPLAPPPVHYPRPICTSILFLLTASAPISHLHRIPCDELWVHIEGDPITIVQVPAEGEECGEYSERRLGKVVYEAAEDDDCQSLSSDINHLFLQPTSGAPRNSPVPPLTAATAPAPIPRSSCYPTHTVPAGTWFGARLDTDSDSDSECRSMTEPPTQLPTLEHMQPSNSSAQSSSSLSSLLHSVGSFFTSVMLSSTPSLSSSASAAASASTSFSSSSSAASSSSTLHQHPQPRSQSHSRRRHGHYGYCLVSCVVSPGFEFLDFQMMTPQEFQRIQVTHKMREKIRQARQHAQPANDNEAMWEEECEAKIQQAEAMVLTQE